MTSHRVARRFVAGITDQLRSRMEGFLAKPLDEAEGRALAEWLRENVRFDISKTPKGGKVFKGALEKLHYWLRNGPRDGDRPGVRASIEDAWADVDRHLEEIVRLFSEEGGVSRPKELRVGSNLYLNLSGFTEPQLKKFAESLEQVFDGLKGWRQKALAGGVRVALAGPKEFRGTAAGKYKREEDTLYVRATPAVLKRTRGSYGSFDYIIVHELGHRYDDKHRLPTDFEQSEWHTSKYSTTETMSGGESFAELFAISNYGITGAWDAAIVDRFEAVMAGGKVEEKPAKRELPPHLQALADKLKPRWQ